METCLSNHVPVSRFLSVSSGVGYESECQIRLREGKALLGATQHKGAEQASLAGPLLGRRGGHMAGVSGRRVLLERVPSPACPALAARVMSGEHSCDNSHD